MKPSRILQSLEILQYTAVVNDIFVPELENVDVDELWLQHDGCTRYIFNETISLLNETFDVRIVSPRGSMAWTPKS